VTTLERFVFTVTETPPRQVSSNPAGAGELAALLITAAEHHNPPTPRHLARARRVVAVLRH
jgi:hypothetical protein